MDSPSATVQRRKVADDELRRARRACTYCQRRKARCFQSLSTTTPSGGCVNCARRGVACSLENTERRQGARPPHSMTPELPSPRSSSMDIPARVETASTSPEKIPDLVIEDLSSQYLLDRVRESMFLGRPSSPTRPSKSPKKSKERLDEGLLERTKRAFPPRQVADFLLGVCIDYGTDYYFYFPHKQFRRRIQEFYDDPDHTSNSSASFLCMALSSFAIGTQFAHLVDNRLTQGEAASMQKRAGSGFYSAAQALVSHLITSPSVESVQALEMLSIYAFPFDARGTSYLYLGLALRMSISIGLHLNSAELDISEFDREVRHRTFWSVFLLEEPMIFRNPTSESMQEVHRLVRELQAWKSSLPRSLDLRHINHQSKLYRAVVHLHANYHHAWIMLTREPLVELVKSTMEHRLRTSSSGPVPNPCQHPLDFPKLCHQAARSMLDLYSTLQSVDMLARSSFTDFQGCSTATVIVLLNGAIHRGESYQSDVKSAFNALSFMAAENDRTRAALHFICSLQRLTDEAYNRIHGALPVEDENLAGKDDALSIYENWLIASREPPQTASRNSPTPGDYTIPTGDLSRPGMAAVGIDPAKVDHSRATSVLPGSGLPSADWMHGHLSHGWMPGIETGFSFPPDDFLGSPSVSDTFIADVTGIHDLLDFGFQ
ncbi:uncharacterized protein E0L32_012135 [Thyridium curvatum]|uniref:Zn(2)-C6 fungal-type domain-containing protein n=1 Tax=Thyridium curvatum TaxID=1093900 RepID=A0A507B5P9_9PEZI|nr:uncharacterized protein E0L32_012135 [Thyridium curvatum]TPX17572.1 hypothetical protein E0L32_012135 [Thyridium curvatum]